PDERLSPREAKARLRAVATRADPLVGLGRHPFGVAVAGFAAGVLSGLSPRALAHLAARAPRGVLLGLGLASDSRRARQRLDEARTRAGPGRR
ncbi:MAG: hypothetical protein ACOCP9_05895, partial [Halofilum sp. (in: g-proteobacteria)]